MKLIDILKLNNINKNINKIKRKSRMKDAFISNLGYSPSKHKEGYPTLKKIPKDNGKHRDIFIYAPIDTLRQKAILDYLIDKYGIEIHKNVYSYKKGVSTMKAINRLMKLSKDKDLYAVSIDITNFFGNVSKEIILKSIDTLLDEEDKQTYSEEFSCVGQHSNKPITSVREYLREHFQRDKMIYQGQLQEMVPSLQAGSPPSAYFANYILRDFDDLISEHPYVEIYSRYADDIIIFSDNIEKLKVIYALAKSELGKLGLSVNDNKTVWTNPNEKLDYLGATLKGKQITLMRKHWVRRKSYVKSICKKYRKIAHDRNLKITKEERHQHKIACMIKAIKEINRKLYTTPKSESNNMYSDAAYIFRTVNKLEDIHWFDNYIMDRLRNIYTNKNNKANYRITKQDLKDIGFIPITDMYSMYNHNKLEYESVLKNEII